MRNIHCLYYLQGKFIGLQGHNYKHVLCSDFGIHFKNCTHLLKYKIYSSEERNSGSKSVQVVDV